MADTLNLLSCAHCGSADVHFSQPGTPDEASYDFVICNGCGVSVTRADRGSDPREVWNRRSTSSVSEGEMPELPALPKQRGRVFHVQSILGLKSGRVSWDNEVPAKNTRLYTADQVKEYARAAIAADRQRMSEANGDEPEWWHRLHAAAESLEDSGATANAIDVRFIAGKLLAATKAAAPAHPGEEEGK